MKRGEWRLQKTPRKEEKVESNQQEKSLEEKVGMKKKPVRGPEDLVERRRITQPGKNQQHVRNHSGNEARKPATTFRFLCWDTEKEYMERYKGTYDIFFGIEQRMEEGGDGG